MRLTRRSILVLSLCVGLVAAALTYSYLAKEHTRATRLSQPVKVVVAVKPIPARTVITPEAVREAMVPVAMLPPDCAVSQAEVAGRVALTTLQANQPVVRTAVAARSATLGMAYVVPKGMRAVAVALDPIIGVAGFLKPGDRVDVVTTISVDSVKVTRTVLQDVTLLAIGPTISPEEAAQPPSNQNARPYQQANATLAVTPSQAERLILAESGGKLRLTLRPADDRQIVTLSGVRSDALTGVSASRPVASPPPAQVSPPVYAAVAPAPAPAPRPAPAPPKDMYTIETIRGTERAVLEVRGP